MAAIQFQQVSGLQTAFLGVEEPSTADGQAVVGEQFYYTANLTFPPGTTNQFLISITVAARSLPAHHSHLHAGLGSDPYPRGGGDAHRCFSSGGRWAL